MGVRADGARTLQTGRRKTTYGATIRGSSEFNCALNNLFFDRASKKFRTVLAVATPGSRRRKRVVSESPDFERSAGDGGGCCAMNNNIET